MTTSEQINELAAALSKAQGEMGGAVKDSANPFFKSKYADLASVREAIRAPFAKQGLSVVQFPKSEYNGAPEPYEWTAKSGEKRYGVRVVCVVSVLTRLLHASGQWMEDSVSTMLPTGDPQAVGSAITYLRRYALQSVAGVAPEDDDAEAAHRGNGAAQATVPAKVMAPTRYADWLLEMQSVADEGVDRLREEWKTQPEAFRTHLTKHDVPAYEALRERAKKATVAA